jgi:hypothetical protein
MSDVLTMSEVLAANSSWKRLMLPPLKRMDFSSPLTLMENLPALSVLFLSTGSELIL